MKRIHLDIVKDLLSFGDIKAYDTDEYRLTDKAVIKLIEEIKRLNNKLKELQ